MSFSVFFFFFFAFASKPNLFLNQRNPGYGGVGAPAAQTYPFLPSRRWTVPCIFAPIAGKNHALSHRLAMLKSSGTVCAPQFRSLYCFVRKDKTKGSTAMSKCLTKRKMRCCRQWFAHQSTIQLDLCERSHQSYLGF
jgi:hypothetical protein